MQSISMDVFVINSFNNKNDFSFSQSDVKFYPDLYHQNIIKKCHVMSQALNLSTK